MEEVTLRAVQRAMPGHGRARIHSSLLTSLGIADNDEVEVVTPGGTSVTLTVFADSLVEKGQIRISADDLKKLKTTDGADVTVRRKVPLSEQVKTVASDVAGRAVRSMHEIGDTVSEKTSGLKEETLQTAQEISSKARDVSDKIAGEIAPIGEKITAAGKETAAKIHEMVPTARFPADVEAGLRQLSPEAAADLKKVLLAGKGEIHVSPVRAASGRTIGNLTIPPGSTILAVQREVAWFSPEREFCLKEGDLVYMSGEIKDLDYMVTVLEG